MDGPSHTEESTETKQPIAFWPRGGGDLDDKLKARRGYYVCGTMTKWETVMMKERNKEHSFTFTMGENRWEDFQVWLDGDSKKIIVPGEAGGIDGPFDGGDEPASLGAWRIDARPTYAITINEDGYETYKEVEGPDTGLIGTQYKIAV